MTEEEAINHLVGYNSDVAVWLYELPKDFHTKEFVIKAAQRGIWFSPNELRQCKIEVDYDIVLVLCVVNGYNGIEKWCNVTMDSYSDFIDNNKLHDKLDNTLRFLGVI